MDYCESYCRDLDEKEDLERRMRVRKALWLQDKIARMEPTTKFCPHCHMQLNANGHCVNGCDD